MVFTVSKFLVLLAVVCFAVATVLSIVGVPNTLPWLVSLGLAFGFSSFLVP